MTVRRILGALALAGLLAGCGYGDSDSSAEATRTRPTGGMTASPLAQSRAAEYTGPQASYTYRLISTCGERSGLGSFDVTVRRGKVVAVRPVDRWSRLQLVRKDIPTLDGFVTTAERARNQGADDVHLTRRAGHVSLLWIDWDTDAIDDEFCWRAADIRAS